MNTQVYNIPVFICIRSYAITTALKGQKADAEAVAIIAKHLFLFSTPHPQICGLKSHTWQVLGHILLVVEVGMETYISAFPNSHLFPPLILFFQIVQMKGERGMFFKICF